MTFIKSLRDAIEALERIRDEHSRINTDEIWACGWCGSNVPIDSQADIQHSADCPAIISTHALANLRASEPLIESELVVYVFGPARRRADILRELDTLIGEAVRR